MIRLAILRPPDTTADAIPLLAGDTGAFEVVYLDSNLDPAKSLPRDLSMAGPEVIVLDVDDWKSASVLLGHMLKATRNAAVVGFRSMWTPEEQAEMEAAGVTVLLSRPFSAAQLEVAAREALHKRRPVKHPNILAFLPSKAGSGCSTVVLNTAAVLANEMGKKVLLIEADRRSGVMSIVLNVEDRGGLPAILAEPGRLTPVAWHQHLVSIGKLDMLLANPLRPGPQPTWATYFQILDFAQSLYDFILVDLPELINPATTEVACAARNVFIVCEPELASLKLVSVRRAELEAVGVGTGKMCVLGNRWEGRRLTKEALEKTAQVPMYAAMPNDYLQVKNAAMESRLVSRDSSFGKGCAELARSITSAEAPAEGRIGSLWRRFGKG